MEVPITTQNSHHMTTMFKVCIFKTKPIAYQIKLIFSSSCKLSITLLDIARSILDALNTLEWHEVIQLEIETLLKNNIWELIKCPKGRKFIECKLVFRVKLKSDDLLDKY